MDETQLQDWFRQALDHQRNGRPRDAEVLYLRLIAELPRNSELLVNLGNVLSDQVRLDDAIAAYRDALKLNPNFVQALHNLGGTLKTLNRLDESLTAYRQALAIKPDFPEALNNVANVLSALNRPDEAAAALTRAAELDPNSVMILTNLASALLAAGDTAAALVVVRRAVAADPRFAGTHFNLGKVLAKLGRLDEAAAALQQAVELQPDLAEARNDLGFAMHGLGELDAAIAAFGHAVRLAPNTPSYHSNLILMMHYSPDLDDAAILSQQKQWEAVHVHAERHVFQNVPSPDRRLRIGYVSGDLWNHAVARNLLPAFQHHNHEAFEIFFYCNNSTTDSVTSAVQACADHWQNVAALPDPDAFRLIQSNRIDVLIDLSQHTGRNRLPLFGMKPAPVQIAFAGYPGGTGLRAMDYRITDPWLDPPDDHSPFAEKPLRLPNSFWLYNGAEQPPVTDLPASQNGYVTFGCLNHPAKANEFTWGLWSQLLKSVPNSRLRILSPGSRLRKQLLDFFAFAGVSADRIEMLPRMSHDEYLAQYQKIDVGLDTFPYNGHVSSLDMLWMGVPLVTFKGSRTVGRGGYSLLNNLNLPDLAPPTADEFVATATKLSTDLPRLAELRRTLRQRMLASPLTDAKRVAQNLETLYRQAWQTWSAEQKIT